MNVLAHCWIAINAEGAVEAFEFDPGLRDKYDLPPGFAWVEYVRADDYRGAVETLRNAAEKAGEERDGADAYAILRDAVWRLIDAAGGQ